MADFTDYLSKPLGEMKRVVLPPGHYFATIKDWSTKESSTNKPMLVFVFTIQSAGEDVDTSLLPEQGVANKQLSYFCMLDADFGQDNIRRVIEATGIETDPAQGFGMYLNDTKGMPVLLQITNGNRDKNDPNSELQENIAKVLPVT